MEEKLKVAIKKAVENLGWEVDGVKVEHPQREEHGDYSSNIAMQIFSKLQISNSKLQRKPSDQAGDYENSRELAEKLKDSLEGEVDGVGKIEVAGAGFVNFYLSDEWLVGEAGKASQEKNYGFGSSMKGKKYLIEHTSPNPNKAMHLGHLRNNVLGMSIARLWESQGAEVIKDAVDNNRGIAIARLMWGYLKYGHKRGVFGEEQNFDQREMIEYWFGHQEEWKSPESEDERPDKFMDKLYVEASVDFKEEEGVEDQVRQMVVDWEAEEEKNWALWRKVLDYVYQGQRETLQRLGSEWNKVWHEHEHYKAGKRLVEKGLDKGVFQKSEGAIVTDLESYDLPDTVVIKSDGTALYITQDLALTKLKKETFIPDRLHWVIGPEQSLALKQMFAVCEQLGIVERSKCEHIAYGYMSIKGEGKMSSRTGTVVYIDDLLDEAVERIKEKMDGKKWQGEELDRVAEQVGVGAVKYSILKTGRMSSMAFSFEESLNLEGDSGPYCQYVAVRAGSVLQKAGRSGKEEELGKAAVLSADLGEKERAVLSWLYRFGEVAQKAGEEFKPNLLAGYLLELGQKFNGFYNSEQIIGSEGEELRLLIVAAVRRVMESGLGLLGIEVPERM